MDEVTIMQTYSKHIDYLLVTALQEERDALLKLFSSMQPSIVNSLPIFQGTINSKRLDRVLHIAVMMLPQMGNVDAGIYTTKAIDYFQPNYVFMVGIAGGFEEKTNKGDLLIATEIIFYESAKLTPDGIQNRQRSIPVDPFLLSCTQNYRDAGWLDLIRAPIPSPQTAPIRPKVHFTPIAVGEKVIADKFEVEKLLKINPKIAGVEMESFGVASAAISHYLRPRFISIRSVCDFADSNKNDDWHDYACAVAAAYAVGFIQEGLVAQGSGSHFEEARQCTQEEVILFRHLSMEPIPQKTVVEAAKREFRRDRFPTFYVDQTDLFIDDRMIDPFQAQKRQIDIPSEYDRLIENNPNAQVAYFGLAHIPLLFHLGYSLTNKRKLSFFEYNRFSGEWNLLNDEAATGPEVYVDGLPIHRDITEGDIVLRISISNSIELKDINPIVDHPLALIHMFIQPVNRDVITSTKQLHYFGMKFREVIDAIHEFFPNRRRVQIFYAGPVSLAVYFGQLIHHGVDRELEVYNYSPKDTPHYSWGLKIADGSGSDPVIQIAENYQGERY